MPSTRAVTIAVLLLLFTASPALAQFDGPGAEQGPDTVQALLDNPQDDQTVTLQGNVLEKVGHEKYAFSDETGQIRVEIESEVFPERRVTPETNVEIYGEVEKDFLRSPEIDAERLTIVTSESPQPDAGQ
ncbi:NirD/YgiW/YdeI family stress tolerance protein [Salinibacter ruber]|uniref:NirD/YgiW/YdeI family stress tolerance protein n=1 Tax=Salinibacter ruber TaxID=146919 RepID=UPI000E56D858|nr:NirD/YgiW/YdeI family stress tolerance protein [Salinibacter ruber]